MPLFVSSVAEPIVMPRLAGEERQREAMDAVVGRLRAALESARAKLARGIGDELAREQSLGALANVARLVDRLATTLRLDVLEGRLPAARWEAIAHELAAGVESIGGDAVTWADFTREVLVQTVSDAGRVVADTATGVARWLPWVAGGAGLLLVLVLAVELRRG